MTDFHNGFNPDRLNGTHFNTNKQGKNKPAETNEAPQEQAPVDRYAGQRLSADEVFSLMNVQAQFNKAGVDHSSIFQSIAAFESAVSPESYEQMLQDVETTFQNEFGFKPSKAFAENVVADRLIGRPSIQTT
ncbi:MAG TPA: hypothetical protein V6C99_05140 [Oculatellaceae cyanobacterium]|jgi:hypothetical protein